MVEVVLFLVLISIGAVTLMVAQHLERQHLLRENQELRAENERLQQELVYTRGKLALRVGARTSNVPVDM